MKEVDLMRNSVRNSSDLELLNLWRLKVDNNYPNTIFASAYERGWLLVYVNNRWIYADTGEPNNGKRSCRHCGRKPTPEGHDACLGTLPDVEWACCGHGAPERGYLVSKPIYEKPILVGGIK